MALARLTIIVAVCAHSLWCHCFPVHAHRRVGQHDNVVCVFPHLLPRLPRSPFRGANAGGGRERARMRPLLVWPHPLSGHRLVPRSALESVSLGV